MAEAISVYKMACARIPTDVGDFTLCLYHNNLDDKEHLALIAGDAADLASDETRPPVLVRVHSECYTGDVLGSRRCDCGPQLAAAMQLIAAEGRGVILYLRQEGRGIGLLDKLRAKIGVATKRPQEVEAVSGGESGKPVIARVGGFGD